MKHKIRFATGTFANYQRIIKAYAGRVHARLPEHVRPWVSLNDLIQEGNIALIEAIRNYRPGKEAKFTTFFITILNATYIKLFQFHNYQKRKPEGKLVQLEEIENVGAESREIMKAELRMYLEETGQENLLRFLE